jgi:hypothetical protein
MARRRLRVCCTGVLNRPYHAVHLHRRPLHHGSLAVRVLHLRVATQYVGIVALQYLPTEPTSGCLLGMMEPVTTPPTDTNASPDPKTLTRANEPPLTDGDWAKHITGQRSTRATKTTTTHCLSLTRADRDKIVDDVAVEFARRPGVADLIARGRGADSKHTKEKGDVSGLKDATKELEAWLIKDSKWAHRFAHAHSGNAAIVREQAARKLVFDGKSRVANTTKQEEQEVDSALGWDIPTPSQTPASSRGLVRPRRTSSTTPESRVKRQRFEDDDRMPEDQDVPHRIRINLPRWKEPVQNDNDAWGQIPNIYGRNVLIFDSRTGGVLEPITFRHLLADNALVDCRAGEGYGDDFYIASLHAAIWQWVDPPIVALWQARGCGLRLALDAQQALDEDDSFASYINRFLVGPRQYKDFAVVIELGEQGRYLQWCLVGDAYSG